MGTGFGRKEERVSDGAQALISKEEALVVAKQALEEASSGLADAISSVNAALRPSGLRYTNSTLNSQSVEYMADDIVRFVQRLDERP